MSKKKTKQQATTLAEMTAPAGPGFWEATLAPLLEKRALAIAICLVVLACARIVASSAELSPTWDEPAHVACGLEYLAKHVYRYEPQHPPLARAMGALLPYLSGVRPEGLPNFNTEGVAIIYQGGHPAQTLALMRAGILVFFVMACAVIFLWAKRSFGNTVAVLAVALFTLVPTVLAHAGLATTDMGLTAGLTAAFFALLLWAETPTWKYSVLLGMATAFALLTKFTTLGYFPAAAIFALLAYVIVEKPGAAGLMPAARVRALPFALAVATGALTVWAGYFFSFGKVPETNLTVPAPELFDGIRFAMYHTSKGHAAYFMGEVRNTGWWYFFPVLLAVKTPLGWLALAIFGLAVAWGRRVRLAYWLPVAFSLGVLVPAMFSHVNIGLRHILPIFASLAILAAIGLARLLERGYTAKWAGPLAVALLAWIAISGIAHHPDYLSYFNELAGDRPERIVVDSDLDWGQNIVRLSRRLKELNATQVAFTDFNLRPKNLAFWPGLPPVQEINPLRPTEGWSAVSPSIWMLRQYGLNYRDPRVQPWFAYYRPVEKVGTLWLYYIPPGSSQRNQLGQ
uniref:Glycosyl transferase, family 39 n=1 Tax=Solibacter usitatus (strain Ellin6076) TaxID=234267 RepID=Q01VC4_SOLUE